MTTHSMEEYPACCHCGAIQFIYRTDRAPADWSIRACQCRFCRAHNALSVSGPDSKIEFRVRDADRLQRYRFGLRTADFLLCRNCGVYTGAVIKTDAGTFGIVNVRALIDVPGDLPAGVPISYDGERTGDRVSRREQRWTRVTGIDTEP